jgi:hypothetical protein
MNLSGSGIGNGRRPLKFKTSSAAVLTIKKPFQENLLSASLEGRLRSLLKTSFSLRMWNSNGASFGMLLRLISPGQKLMVR